MTFEAIHAPERQAENIQLNQANQSSQDNFAQFRYGGRLMPAVATSADAQLPAMQIADSTAPNNPYGSAGQYNQGDINVAKQHFSPDEVSALEKMGPANFNQMMEAVKNAPKPTSDALVKQFKFIVDPHPQPKPGNKA
jgi:hypothetical protein